MPVEIKELVIRAIVAADSPDDDRAAQRSEFEQEQIVEQCVRQVLAILRKSAER